MMIKKLSLKEVEPLSLSEVVDTQENPVTPPASTETLRGVENCGLNKSLWKAALVWHLHCH